jgi:hypothetical protein
MMTELQDSPGPIIPDLGPDPKQILISHLLKILAALIGLIILGLAAYLFVYAPLTYMKNSRFPVHIKWKALAASEVSEASAKVFQDTDKMALVQGFKPTMVFSPLCAADCRSEEKLYISNDSRTGFTIDCFWSGYKIYCIADLVTFFENGVEVVTTNYKYQYYNEPNPKWLQVYTNSKYRTLDVQYHDQLKAVEKAVKDGGIPVLLTPENAQVTVTGFQDKTNKWRAEHGVLEKVPGQEAYQFTYRTALNRILIHYKLRSVSK